MRASQPVDIDDHAVAPPSRLRSTSERAEPAEAAPTSIPPQDLPRAFGPYLLFDRIGRGGMAEIFLARRRTTEAGGGRRMVIKQILPELSENPQFAAALVQEAKLAARLNHANVVQVFDLGEEDRGPRQRLFIAMEYVEGLDLRELLVRCSRERIQLPLEFTFLIVLETLRALDYAHRRCDEEGRPLGIVHRDVSPSNVLLSLEGEVKLCDFGIARALDAVGPEVTHLPEAIQGKAGYMSPEQASGKPLDSRADLFSIGVILWELLAGRRMHQPRKEAGETVLDLARIGKIPPLPARGLPRESELHAWLSRALAHAPEDRFATAGEMLDQLHRWVVRARVLASPIRFGEWLCTHFGNRILEERRARERAATRALGFGSRPSVVDPMAGPGAAMTAPSEPRLTPAPDASHRPLLSSLHQPLLKAPADLPTAPDWSEKLAVLPPDKGRNQGRMLRLVLMAVLVACLAGLWWVTQRGLG